MAYSTFSLWRADTKSLGLHRIRVGEESAREKLRIQKYPDTCG